MQCNSDMCVHAGHLVRAAATVGGNVVLARQRALQSDYCTIMIAAGAEVEVTSRAGARCAATRELSVSNDATACCNQARWVLRFSNTTFYDLRG